MRLTEWSIPRKYNQVGVKLLITPVYLRDFDELERVAINLYGNNDDNDSDEDDMMLHMK